MFYCQISVNIDSNEGFLKNGQDPLLTIWSAGHALQVFINGQLSGKRNIMTDMIMFLGANIACQQLTFSFYPYAGTVYGSLENPKLTFSKNVKLRPGVNKISLLSTSVGLPVSFLTFVISLFFKKGHWHLTFYSLLSIWSISECGHTLWEMECWGSWASNFEGSKWGDERHI